MLVRITALPLVWAINHPCRVANNLFLSQSASTESLTRFSTQRPQVHSFLFCKSTTLTERFLSSLKAENVIKNNVGSKAILALYYLLDFSLNLKLFLKINFLKWGGFLGALHVQKNLFFFLILNSFIYLLSSPPTVPLVKPRSLLG